MTYVKLSCIFVASLIAGCQTSRDAPKSVAPSWPTWATEAQPRLDGLTNTLVDFIGPIDGSAKLTIFTEGNHYPVLLPMVFDRFSEWCPKPECELKGEEVLVVTLPQRLIVEALLQKRIQLGQATLNLSTSGVWPDIVMAGRAPLTKLAEAGIIAPEASVFAKHKGLGLLVQRDAEITNLSELISSDARVVFATPWERGARAQYKKTIDGMFWRVATLVRIVLEQQVSLASARAVFVRLTALCGGRVTARRLAEHDEASLRAQGCSRQKARYLRQLADDVVHRRLVVGSLARASNQEVIERITARLGLGRWSADVYLMMALRRPDIAPIGDLALRKGIAELDSLDDYSVEELAERARGWAPHRSSATRIVWQAYLHRRNRKFV